MSCSTPAAGRRPQRHNSSQVPGLHRPESRRPLLVQVRQLSRSGLPSVLRPVPWCIVVSVTCCRLCVSHPHRVAGRNADGDVGPWSDFNTDALIVQDVADTIVVTQNKYQAAKVRRCRPQSCSAPDAMPGACSSCDQCCLGPMIVNASVKSRAQRVPQVCCSSVY